MKTTKSLINRSSHINPWTTHPKAFWSASKNTYIHTRAQTNTVTRMQSHTYARTKRTTCRQPWSMCYNPGMSTQKMMPTSATWLLVNICGCITCYSHGVFLLHTPRLCVQFVRLRSSSFRRAGVRKQEIKSPKQMQNTVWHLAHVITFCFPHHLPSGSLGIHYWMQVDNIMCLRTYLDYHLKCSKSHLMSMMRSSCSKLLKGEYNNRLLRSTLLTELDCYIHV